MTTGDADGTARWEDPLPAGDLFDAATGAEVEIDPATRGVEDVVVTLKPLAKRKGPRRADGPKGNGKVLRIDQQGGLFGANVRVVAPGTIVEFTNTDTEEDHSVVIRAARNRPLDVPIPAGKVVRWEAAFPERLVAICGVHPWVRTRLVVAESPYFAKSDRKGRLRIKGVPAGRSKVRLWHGASGKGAGRIRLEGPREVVIRKGRSARLRVSVRAADGLATPRRWE